MSYVALLFVVYAVAAGVFHYWKTDAYQRHIRDSGATYLIWALKGAVLPLVVWTFFNSGWLITPLLPDIADAQNNGRWADAFWPITSGITFVVVTWWAAVTLAWIAARVFLRHEQRRELFVTAGLWLLVAVPVGALIVAAAGRAGMGLALALCFGMVTHAILPLIPIKIAPTYSRALAKIAFDRFNEAEWEIINQLEKAENDFEGWMLLAQLYATHFHDLASAERTVCELCDDPHTTPPQVAIALNRLADWQLSVADNPQHARWALEKICDRLPDTHMARMAQLRIQQLPTTREEWLATKDAPKTVKLVVHDFVRPAKPPPRPEPVEDSVRIPVFVPSSPPRTPITPPPAQPETWHVPTLHLHSATEPVADARAIAKAEAKQLVARLQENPDDVDARERFANIEAEKLGNVDLGSEQLQLLLGMPNQNGPQRARWMNTLADWYLRLKHDPATARTWLQRITAEHPHSHEAFEAQRRLYVMDLEHSARLRRRA